jgi:hypothetical protein
LPDKQKGQELDLVKQKDQRASCEDKLATLKEFHRRNGLCFKCGEKWGHNHKCPAQISLHVIEELLDDWRRMAVRSTLLWNVSEETVMAVGVPASAAVSKRRTMKFCGQIGKIQALILVDSGSVGTFISDHLAQQLPHKLTECERS